MGYCSVGYDGIGVWRFKCASALGTECPLNAHSIRIDRVRTRNVKVPTGSDAH